MLSTRKVVVLPYFSIGTFEKAGVRIKKLEYNNWNSELMRTLNLLCVFVWFDSLRPIINLSVM